MAKAYDTKLDWVTIDPDTLAPDHRAAYEEYKAAYRLAKDARTAFENGMQAQAPVGKRMCFGYNFGKLSIALDAAKDAPKAAKGVQSLASFLAEQAGHRH